MKFFSIILLFFLFLYISNVMYPSGPCKPLRVTHYDASKFGSSCQLGRGSSTAPPYLYVAAPNYPFRNTSRPCGVCYEITGPMGSVRVMVVSTCPDCKQDMLHFDVSDETFPKIVDQDRGVGVAIVSYREITCDSEGAVKLRWKDGSNKWSFYVVIFNHIVGVESLAINEGSGFQNLTRETWNEFKWSHSGSELKLPITFRLLSWYGDSIDLEVSAIQPGNIISFSRQFLIPEVLKENYKGSCCVPQDVHSKIYDDKLIDCWADWSSFAENLKDTNNPHSGTYCISASLNAWNEVGYGCSAEARADQYKYLEFWARTDKAIYDDLQIRFSSGKYSKLYVTEVKGLTNSWKRFQVNVSSTITFFSFSKVAFKNEGKNSVALYLDDIKLVQDENAPKLNQCAPGVFGGPPPEKNDPDDFSNSSNELEYMIVLIIVSVVLVICN